MTELERLEKKLEELKAQGLTYISATWNQDIESTSEDRAKALVDAIEAFERGEGMEVMFDSEGEMTYDRK